MEEIKCNGESRKLSSPDENSSESKRGQDGQSYAEVYPNGHTKGELLEKILERSNLNKAYKQVKSNKGSAGMDGITTDELLEHLKEHRDEIIGKIRARKYKPTPVRRVQIPKPNGKMRDLGIPSTTDRVIQQAISQVLGPIYEEEFSDNSFGFRPNRSCHTALLKVKEIVDEGYSWVVDLDLEKFFDTVNQSKLIEILQYKIRDGDVISLIHKFLGAGIMENGIKVSSERGVPQGGPLSPLLANIYLNEADKKFEEWGYKFVRYADDMLIFARNKKAAERYFQRVKKLLEGVLKLKVNKEKSSIHRIESTKFLSYKFYKHKGLKYKVPKDNIKKLKAKLKEITSRSNGWSYEFRRERLNQVIRGWIQYFKMANMGNHIKAIDEWLRRRIRMCAWKSWKKIRSKFTNLMRLGIAKQQAWEWANTRKGYWRIAGSWILNTTLTNERIAGRGYISALDYYQKVQVKL